MTSLNKTALTGIALLAALLIGVSALRPAPDADRPSYIVQGRSLPAIAALVERHGGTITHELGVIRAVAADLSRADVENLRQHRDVLRIYHNGAVYAAGKPDKGGDKGGPGTNGAGSAIDTYYTKVVNGQALHLLGIDGRGIGIAVLDTGLWKHDAIKLDSTGNVRIRAVYDAITDTEATSPLSGDDPGGHGSHIASIAVSSLLTPEGLYNGIAPGAHLVSVRAFDEFGQGTYADVIRAVDWVVANREMHDIRILNLSFSATPQSYYWDDPINQAVMTAWQNGIFVVAAAGNRGPDPMTIGVPGNVPYVMTVGATSDNYTPADISDDVLVSFSSAGPTYEGFVKPEVVAPGGHMLGLMQNSAQLATPFTRMRWGLTVKFWGNYRSRFHISNGDIVLTGTPKAARTVI